ncbi:MAG: acetyl-CoA carboxylase biotin carboxyl carrier protein [Flavobacteriales bacterium]|jgi:acetyl-CoA carboxylase biotin carboxyl carrier protein
MNLTEIQDLIKFVAKSGVTEVEIEQNDFKITIKSENKAGARKRGPAELEAQYVQVPVQNMPQQMHMPQTAPAPAPATAPAPAAAPAEENTQYIEVKSPMIGTFYRRPSPDTENFFEVGETIKKGDVVCIIEAMKLFNEIEAEISGKIVKVLVDDNSPVEYDQPLFLVDPS